MIGNLICKEAYRVSQLAKAARVAQEQARKYVIGPMGEGYEDQDEEEDASSDRAMAYDQRMKAEAYKGARKLTERWLIEDMELRMAAAEYEELRAKAGDSLDSLLEFT